MRSFKKIYCLFDNIAYQNSPLTLSSQALHEKGLELRQQVVDHMRKNFDEYQHRPDQDELILFKGDGSVSEEYESFEDYLGIMAEDLTWAGEPEILALSELLGRPIVNLCKTATTKIYNENSLGIPIFIEHVNSNHFVSRIFLKQDVSADEVIKNLMEANGAYKKAI